MTGGLQIRFHWSAEFHSYSFRAQIKSLEFTEYHQNMHLLIVVDVMVDVKNGIKNISNVIFNSGNILPRILLNKLLKPVAPPKLLPYQAIKICD